MYKSNNNNDNKYNKLNLPTKDMNHMIKKSLNQLKIAIESIIFT